MGTFFDQFLIDCKPIHSLVQFSTALSAYQYRKPFTMIARFLRPESHALDWGCGNGHLSTFLLHHQQKTTAYAFGETAPASVIAGHPLLEFIVANTEEPVALPFEDNAFDLVLSMGVLEHVHESGGDQRASLKEIRRILKPGGYFLCFHFPFSGSWVEKLHGAIMPFKKKKSYVHTRKFSEQDVKTLCRDARLSLEEWGRYNFLPRNFSRRLPGSITNNAVFLASFNAVDDLLVRAFPQLCNQSYFIAQKKDSEA